MMTHVELQALRHPRIVAFHKFFSEYHMIFEVASERFKISIRVYETGDGRFFFEQSHYIRTPMQDSPDRHEMELHHGSDVALSRGVESITTYYEDAITQGHQPKVDWFVPNPVFR